MAALLLGSETPPAPPPPAPLIGFSYSPLLAEWSQTDPATDLAMLLDATNPDLVRLPVYWELVQPSPHNLDFSSVDNLLAVVARHNQTSSRYTRVILTVGARNFLYPELHSPAWAGPRQQPQLGVAQAGSNYRVYFDASVLRYRSSPLIYAWQVENEPFDYVVNEVTGADQISPEQVQWEIDEVHKLDPAHRVVTTTFNAWNVIVDWMQMNTPPLLAALHGYPSGHPEDALDQTDALGLDVYVDGATTPLRFASVALRSSWKAETIRYWGDVAAAQHKDIWLTEMQAQPWSSSPGFTPDDLLTSASMYRTDRLSVVLLWGVETWLQDPAWMHAAIKAMGILRSP